jgi:oligo-1,6-glucosidase/alpha-glucosidase
LKNPWWQTTTIYQIYPRSFADANHDGIGDLRGIISKLDYVQDLGFETVWFSPFFCSPQDDFGYDVSDYCDIAPEYGTLAEAEELIQEVHARGMRVLFDLVLNHTSIQHPWFQESRSSRSNPKRDWYIWRDGRGKRPPNNWKATPGGSGWHHDENTDQWFYASFLPFQPDLNWRNPAVKQAMFDIVRFWLDKGVDGFRLDIFHSIYKDDGFRDNPFSRHLISLDEGAGHFQEWKYTINQPEVFDLAVELRALVDSYTPKRMLIGEVFGSVENQKRFLGKDLDGLQLVFLWELLNLKGTASFLREVIEHYEHHYPAPYTPVYVYGNHDRKRLISRCGNDIRIAELLALMQFTVRGVPVTYYGEEIGMADGGFPARAALDPVARNLAWVPPFLFDLLGLPSNRDGCRTPMQWDASPNAGFCSAEVAPWLPVHENRAKANVADQLKDDDSLLNLYRALLRLRRDTPVLQTGNLALIDDPAMDENILAYQRSDEDQTILVVLNFGDREVEFHNPTDCQDLLFSTGIVPIIDRSHIFLPAYAGIVLSRGAREDGRKGDWGLVD